MKKLLIPLILVALLVAAIIYFNDKPQSQPSPPDDTQPLGSMPSNIKDSIAGNVWFGTLKQSDNSAIGNLMLVFLDQSKVYVQTSRDYSALLDKEVAMEIKGTKESFQLIEIHPNY